MNRHFLKEEIQMINKRSLSLAIREMQFKLLGASVSPQAECLSLRKQAATNAEEDVQKEEHFLTSGVHVNQCGHYGNQWGCSSKYRK